MRAAAKPEKTGCMSWTVEISDTDAPLPNEPAIYARLVPAGGNRALII